MGRSGCRPLLQEYSRTRRGSSAVTALSITMPLSAKSMRTAPPCRSSIVPGASHWARCRGSVSMAQTAAGAWP